MFNSFQETVQLSEPVATLVKHLSDSFIRKQGGEDGEGPFLPASQLSTHAKGETAVTEAVHQVLHIRFI